MDLCEYCLMILFDLLYVDSFIFFGNNLIWDIGIVLWIWISICLVCWLVSEFLYWYVKRLVYFNFNFDFIFFFIKWDYGLDFVFFSWRCFLVDRVDLFRLGYVLIGFCFFVVNYRDYGWSNYLYYEFLKMVDIECIVRWIDECLCKY